jgi:hypothetical protein
MDPVKPCLLGVLGLLAIGCGGGGGSSSSYSGGSATLGGDAADGTGEVDVNVIVNHSPGITSMPARETFLLDPAGQAVSVEAEISVEASDVDGDELSYEWSSPNCPDATISLPDPLDPRAIHFHNEGDEACELRVVVRDLWEVPPAGMPAAKGGEAVGTVLLSRPPELRVGGE